MLEKEEIILIIYFIVVAVFIIVFVVAFVLAFLRRKNKLLLRQIENQQRFEKELADAQIEIQEQTLKNIGWELHDNIGQLLSVANMQLNVLTSRSTTIPSEELKETNGVIQKTVQEVRALSKSLNADVILKHGLVQSIANELRRFNRLNFLKAQLEVRGEECSLRNEDEILIFRILQEFLSNVIKHAKADNLFVTLTYTSKSLVIKVEDDGIGFDVATEQGNSGLHTMESRARLLHAAYQLTSAKDEGTKLELKYPLR